MKDKMRKRYQSSLNKKIRELNKAIEEDNLWLGRFIARQTDAYWEKFSDSSGGILRVVIRMYDKKTGFYKDFILDYAPYFKTINWHISMDIVNHFIVKDLLVWERENPRAEIKNWVNYPIKKNIFNTKEQNFYSNIKNWKREA